MIVRRRKEKSRWVRSNIYSSSRVLVVTFIQSNTAKPAMTLSLPLLSVTITTSTITCGTMHCLRLQCLHLPECSWEHEPGTGPNRKVIKVNASRQKMCK